MKVSGSYFKRTFYCYDCGMIIWTRLQASLHFNKSKENHKIVSSGYIPNYYCMSSPSSGCESLIGYLQA